MDVRERIERILEGKEDDRLFGKKEEPKKEQEQVPKETEEKETEEWYGLHLLPEVPGMEIVKSLGIVHVYSDPNGFFHRTDENDIKEVWLMLKEKAVRKGANAVVNVRIVFGTKGGSADGTGSVDPTIYAYGEAVIVRPKGS